MLTKIYVPKRCATSGAALSPTRLRVFEEVFHSGMRSLRAPASASRIRLVRVITADCGEFFRLPLIGCRVCAMGGVRYWRLILATVTADLAIN